MKYMRLKADGFVIAFNPSLVGNPLFEEFETDGNPHLPKFTGEPEPVEAAVKGKGKGKKAAESDKPEDEDDFVKVD